MSADREKETPWLGLQLVTTLGPPGMFSFGWVPFPTHTKKYGFLHENLKKKSFKISEYFGDKFPI